MPESGDDRGRTALFALVDGPFGPIPFFTTQLSSTVGGSGLRCEQVRRLAQFVAEETGGGGTAVLTGDLNAEPDSAAYQLLTEALKDTRQASETGHFGPDGTFGTFTPHDQPAPRIDYIFVSTGIRVMREGTLAHHWNGRHASDHWPVMAELRLVH